MADVQLDVASANRFISSLSKSLQALCHGCMDFDAGIEIVGYINVNIDSGSKVDYVLNEKVLKSTTNSMTFVSNSFLAQKEQQKNLKDGSCSPIPELNYPQQRTQGNYSYPATQLYRSSGIYSPHSQVVRGSQKRQWASGDWRMSPRKYSRGAKSQHNLSYQHQQSLHSQDESYSPYSSQQMSNTTSATIPSQQEHDSSGADQSQSDVNIKKEVEDSTSETAAVGESTDQANGSGVEDVNIKADPDATTVQDTSENVPSKSETDISDSFLQQPTKTDNTSEDSHNIEAKQDNNETDYDPTYSESYGEGGDNSNVGADFQGQSGADGNYEESSEMFTESYSGEGTSGGGQFEVIEIDDDDEDVAAMFDETHDDKNAPIYTNDAYNRDNNTSKFDYGYDDNPSLHRRSDTLTVTAYGYQHHTCFVCQRRFPTRRGLKQHSKCHQHPQFECNTCGFKFKFKHHLKRHAMIHEREIMCARVGSSYEGNLYCHHCDSKFFLKHHLKTHLKLVHKINL